MIKLICIALATILSGCSTTVALKQPINQTLTATIGSPIASWRWTVYQAYPARSMAGALMYGGVDNHVALISYREFSGSLGGGPNFSESGYSQELRVDLKASSQFSFRGLLLQVNEATPSYIKYAILSGPAVENVEANL